MPLPIGHSSNLGISEPILTNHNHEQVSQLQLVLEVLCKVCSGAEDNGVSVPLFLSVGFNVTKPHCLSQSVQSAHTAQNEPHWSCFSLHTGRWVAGREAADTVCEI